MRGATRAVGAAAVVSALLGISRPAAAHALGAECTLNGGEVRLEAYFDDDTAAAEARVVVRDEKDNIVVEGRTDAKGLWRFPAPLPGLYRVTVDAGAGHQATIRLRIPERAEKSSALPSSAENVSEGPSRAEFTRFPWGGAALGLTAIALLFVGWRGLRQRQRRGSSAAGAAQPTLPMSNSSQKSERQ